MRQRRLDIDEYKLRVFVRKELLACLSDQLVMATSVQNTESL